MDMPKRETRKNKPYQLVPYDPTWPVEFAKLKPCIAPLYGDNLIDFQHIGSTAVPGMLAKPVIDVCAIVKNIDKVRKIRPKFEAIGFTAKGDYVGQGEEYFVYDDASGKRTYNIHTLQIGNPAIESYLSFRDYLRAHPDARQAYIAIKESLRARYGSDDYHSYDMNKGDLIITLKQEALVWHRSAHHTNP